MASLAAVLGLLALCVWALRRGSLGLGALKPRSAIQVETATSLGTQEMPSNQILIGLTLFLTMFIMAPVADKINDRAVQPALAGKLSVTDALTQGAPPLRDFMLKQTRAADLALFIEMGRVAPS